MPTPGGKPKPRRKADGPLISPMSPKPPRHTYQTPSGIPLGMGRGPGAQSNYVERMQARQGIGGGPLRDPSASRALTARQRAAADQLKGTVKGGGGGSGTSAGGVVNGGTPILNGGHSVQGEVLNPKPPKPSPTVQQALDAYAEKINGGQPITAAALQNWTPDQHADYAEAAIALRTNAALGGIPQQLSENLGAFASQFTQAVQNIRQQVTVGGTKGTARPVDRSAAVRQAWATRRKLYGTSGTKD